MPIDSLNLTKIAQSRPSSRLSEKENFLKLIKLFVDKAQEVEDALLELASQKDLDTVVGVWLDYLGKIVDAPRDGREDEDYRKFIRLKIGINKSDGSPDVVTELLQTYTKSTRVRIAEFRLAWGQIMVNGEENLDASAYSMLEQVRPVATRLFLLKYQDNTFFPQWELRIPISELFQVFTSGGLDDLELILDTEGATSSLFVTSIDDNNTTVKNEIGQPFLEWERTTSLQLFDGVTISDFEVQISPTESDVLQVDGISEGVTGEVTLCWEINEDSTD